MIQSLEKNPKTHHRASLNSMHLFIAPHPQQGNCYQIRNSYQKNYQYGNGGYAKISRSNFKDNDIYLSSDNKSTITIDDSSFDGNLNIKDDQIFLTQNNSFEGNKNVFNLYDEFINEINQKGLNKIKNINLRGSDFLNKQQLN